MDLRDRLQRTFQALPLAHQVGMGIAVVALAMLSFLFFQWVSAPSYTVLAAGLDDNSMASVVDALETSGVPYQIGAGGSTVLVPRDRLYATRAAMAQAGVATETRPAGYELLSEQGLSVSDFRQRVDYQRALEGELARTLMAVDGIRSATVHLVIPEQALFTERQEATTASVLVDTVRTLSATEVEAVSFLVASSVQGLEAGGITVADASGNVLHAPGDAGVPGAVASRQLRQTREYEQVLAGEITALLARATGSPASVVVRAQLNYDESSSESEIYDPNSQVAVKEQVRNESFEGDGTSPEGVVGVDGGPLPEAADGSSTYSLDETLTEYGVDRTVTRTVRAPGEVEKLSVAIVMDDGSASGATIPASEDIEALVAAAVGLEAARGDTIAVTAVPFPVAEEAPAGAAATAEMLDRVPQIVALLVLLLVAGGLFLMTRRRGSGEELPALAAPAGGAASAGEPLRVIEVEGGAAEAVVAAPRRRELPTPPDDTLKREVEELVERQPEEIATLLRGWLADQRSA